MVNHFQNKFIMNCFNAESPIFMTKPLRYTKGNVADYQDGKCQVIDNLYY